MKFKLNEYIKNDIENKDHPSDFEIAKDYSVLILRLPFIKDEKVEVVSYAFFIKDDKIYIYDRESDEFVLLGDFMKLHDFLDIRIDKITLQIEKLEIIKDCSSVGIQISKKRSHEKL